MGSWVDAGNTSTTRTLGSTLASVAYTMPNGTSPRATKVSAVRTLSAAAIRFSIPDQTPRLVRAACAYLPAGTDAGSPVARRPGSPKAAASANPGAILSLVVLSAGATRTRPLGYRLQAIEDRHRLRAERNHVGLLHLHALGGDPHSPFSRSISDQRAVRSSPGRTNTSGESRRAATTTGVPT